ncbi:MAG: flagellar filament capping protein FliD [Lachnospiraceae bacterium]|nr:flagellar filament capping protein FliD [Lachnospiraceae bacterium]
MAIRLSGLTSGLDTEAIVSAMVSAYSAKKDKYVKAQTKLSWKQDAYKSINAKVYGLYKDINALRFSSAYSLKKVSVSDSTKASVTAAGSALNGSHELSVAQLAKAGYLTGGQVKEGIKSSSKLSDLGITEDGSINVTAADGTPKTIKVESSMTVGAFVNKLNDAGLKASFDETNRRFFISAKESGASNDFSISAANTAGTNALLKLGLYTAPEEGSAQYTSYAALAEYKDGTKLEGKTLAEVLQSLRDAHDTITTETEKKSKTDAAMDYANQYKYLEDLYKKTDTVADGTGLTKGAAAKKLDELLTKGGTDAAYYDMSAGDGEQKYFTRMEEFEEDGVTKYRYYYKDENDDEQSKVYTEKLKTYDEARNILAYDAGLLTRTGEEGSYEYKDDHEYASAFLHARIIRDEYQGKAAPDTMNPESEDYDADAVAVRENILKIQQAYANGKFDDENAENIEGTPKYYEKLSKASQDAIDEANETIEKFSALDPFRNVEDANEVAAMIDEAYRVINSGISTEGTASAGATRVNGQDSIIYLNGAQFTSSSNKYTINGLTINATGTTGSINKTTGKYEGDTLTITTATDVDGIYDKVKDFLSKYNEVVNSLSSLYNADSAKGYEPLTDDEKEQLTDTQAEKWEQKIKDAILRRDQTVGNIINVMSTAMSRSYMVNGKSYSLASFGIKTMGYFNADINEKYAYHIDGDEDDSNTSTNADKLRAAIDSDPESVTDFLKQLTDGLYKSLDKQMKRSSLKSAYTIYNDKEMSKEYSDYTKLIKKWEDRITTMEESYFKKFTAMEKALATMQNNSSSLTGMLGG